MNEYQHSIALIQKPADKRLQQFGMEEIEKLRERVRLLEEENARLRRSKILSNNDKISCAKDGSKVLELEKADSSVETDHASSNTFQGDLKPEEIERYSRQLLLSGQGGFGVEGQLKLLNSTVLVVGAGGIGSTGKD